MFNKKKMIIAVSGFVFATSSPVESAQSPVFTETGANICVACTFSQSEIEAQGRWKYAGGVAWIDYNNDGLKDIFLPNVSPGGSRIFRNLGSTGDGGETLFSSVDAGVEVLGAASTGVTVGDFDGDGFDDLFVTNEGASNTLLRNMGDGRFEDVTEAVGLNFESKASYVAASGDIDRDGDLDLYVGNWIIKSPGCPRNDLYLNKLNETGVFERVDFSVFEPDERGCTFATAFTDHNLDGKLDIFVVNDDVLIATDQDYAKNKLYLNGGNAADGTPSLFEVSGLTDINLFDKGNGSGPVEHTFQGMGIATGDYDNDGDLDYHRTSIGPGLLSQNTSSGTFITRFITQLFGDPEPSTAAWGSVFFDSNNDGWLDLFVVNTPFNAGAPPRINRLYLNEGGVNNQFLSGVSTQGVLNNEHANGVAVADYDNDGDVDVITHRGSGEVALYRNDTVTDNGSLGVKLRGLAPNLKGIGAIIRVTTNATVGQNVVTQLREVHSGSSHGSTSDMAQIFGIGTGSFVESIQVNWPTGCVQNVSSISLVNGAFTEVEIYETDCQYATTYSITGVVTEGTPAQPVVGAQIKVQASTGDLKVIGTAVTDGAGQYVVNGVPDGASYGVTASKAGFTSQIRLTNVFSADSVRNLKIAQSGYLISGQVRSSVDGSGLSGVTVTLSPNAGGAINTVTDGNGRYEFGGLAAGFYSVTSAVTGFSIIPGAKIRKITDENRAVNFLATPN
ncbi:hypothetical protein MNBD_GAMMA11-3201 [hydrothermal vent metagenome]|uniref:ASPIC/UnbV domain-containing protein n=1 Tax=hydrothermal vent metagenome TaxID=652676 RepID=A0A3B0XF82_9ZZZZ